MSYYTCGCCGDGFQVKGQDPVHDTGFGTCSRCETWIGGREEKQWDEWEALVAKSLNTTNREKFLGFEQGVRRGIVGKMIDDGVLKWEIKNQGVVKL